MKLFFTSCLLLITCTVFAQNNGSIKGTVTDASMNNEPVLFANVQLKGSDFETETNFHGNFEFKDLEAGDYTAVISYLGYDTEEVTIKVTEEGTSKISTSLKSLQLSFEDVAVVDGSTASVSNNSVAVEEYPNK